MATDARVVRGDIVEPRRIDDRGPVRSQKRRDASSFAVLSSNRSKWILRSMPSPAATWPCGNDRSILSPSSLADPAVAGIATPPLSRPLRPAISEAGSLLRLASVRFCAFPASSR